MGSSNGFGGVKNLWSTHAPRALVIALLVCALDQASKLWLLWSYDIAIHQPVALTPFLDVVLVWNKGVSYGLLALDSTGGQWALGAIQLTISLALWLWLNTAPAMLTRLSLALIIGGALGNTIDRFLHEGVADFFLLHLRALGSDLNWYVFNLADVAIVAGVTALLYESVFADNRRSGM